MKHQHRSSGLAVTLACLLPAAGSASTLLQAYRDALSNDPAYASAQASAQGVQEKLEQARAGLMPSANMQLSGGNNNDTFTGKKKHYDASNATLAVTQPLFNYGNWVDYRQAPALIERSEGLLAQARVDLVMRLLRAWFDVAESQGVVDAAQVNRGFLVEQVKQARKSLEMGTTAITDLHEAEARLDQAIAQESSAESQLRVRQAALRSITGEPPAAWPQLATLPPLITGPQPAEAQSWENRAADANHAVLAGAAAVTIAELDEERARAAHYPTVDLVGNLGRNSADYSASTGGRMLNFTREIGVQINIPLFRGGATESKVREAHSALIAAQADLRDTRRKAMLSADEAFFGAQDGVVQVKGLEAALKSAEVALQSNRAGQRFGVRTLVDVLNAQQQLHTVRRDLLKARLDTLFSLMKLEAAAGGLDEDDLRVLAPYFQ